MYLCVSYVAPLREEGEAPANERRNSQSGVNEKVKPPFTRGTREQSRGGQGNSDRAKEGKKRVRKRASITTGERSWIVVYLERQLTPDFVKPGAHTDVRIHGEKKEKVPFEGMAETGL